MLVAWKLETPSCFWRQRTPSSRAAPATPRRLSLPTTLSWNGCLTPSTSPRRTATRLIHRLGHGCSFPSSPRRLLLHTHLRAARSEAQRRELSTARYDCKRVYVFHDVLHDALHAAVRCMRRFWMLSVLQRAPVCRSLTSRLGSRFSRLLGRMQRDKNSKLFYYQFIHTQLLRARGKREHS